MVDHEVTNLVDEMKNDDAKYFELASVVWNRLPKEEQDKLAFIATNRSTWEGPVIKDPSLLALIEYKLVTKATSGGEEGLIVLTFKGYAVYKSNLPKDPNVILPGERKL